VSISAPRGETARAIHICLWSRGFRINQGQCRDTVSSSLFEVWGTRCSILQAGKPRIGRWDPSPPSHLTQYCPIPSGLRLYVVFTWATPWLLGLFLKFSYSWIPHVHVVLSATSRTELCEPLVPETKRGREKKDKMAEEPSLRHRAILPGVGRGI
jgi:hypothetical protein